MLENFYDYINAKTYIENGDLVQLKNLISQLPIEHSYRSELCDNLAQALAYKVNFMTDKNDIKIPKEKLLEALDYALDGKNSFLQFAMNYINPSVFPSLNTNPMVGWLKEIKTPVASPDEKKMIINSLRFLRNEEKLSNASNDLKITKLNKKLEILANELAGSPILAFSRAQTYSNSNMNT